MPQISVNDLKNGITLELDNGLFQVVEFQHVKPGKGGAFVRTKIRNVKTGAVIDKTFNAGIKVEQAIVDRQDMQFLYKDGADYVFMNTSTYDQMNVPSAALGEAADYLTEQMVAQIAQYQGEIIGVDIPASVELTIAQTEPGVQGDRVSGAAFVARHGDAAMLHALEVVPALRRQGCGRNILRAAAAWARAEGAATLAVLVTERNFAARALYASLNLQVVGQYHYRALLPPEKA